MLSAAIMRTFYDSNSILAIHTPTPFDGAPMAKPRKKPKTLNYYTLTRGMPETPNSLRSPSSRDALLGFRALSVKALL